MRAYTEITHAKNAHSHPRSHLAYLHLTSPTLSLWLTAQTKLIVSVCFTLLPTVAKPISATLEPPEFVFHCARRYQILCPDMRHGGSGGAMTLHCNVGEGRSPYQHAYSSSAPSPHLSGLESTTKSAFVSRPWRIDKLGCSLRKAWKRIKEHTKLVWGSWRHRSREKNAWRQSAFSTPSLCARLLHQVVLLCVCVSAKPSTSLASRLSLTTSSCWHTASCQPGI